MLELCLKGSDVIIGYADASTSVRDNDFVLRGEYEGGPDGCAIDLETDCQNLRIGPNNTFWKSVGASVNVLGHTFNGVMRNSKNLTVAGNAIVQNGCQQGKPPYFAGYTTNGTGSLDNGAVGFAGAGGSGTIEKNLIVKCKDQRAPLWGGGPTHRADFSLDDNTFVEAAEESKRICSLPVRLRR